MHVISRYARPLAVAALTSSALIGISAAPSFAVNTTSNTASAWQPPVGMSFSGTGNSQLAATTSAGTAMASWAAGHNAICVKRSSTSQQLSPSSWNVTIQAECFFG
ncbi:hypothetical protein [Streptomyces collinus]|uniref:hypothetical protein n=1 Tax=Streptomyces collinus TaxID=42684 RepID=UPI0036CAF04B